MIASVLAVTLVFSNKHIKRMYLHKSGQEVTFEFHTFFSLWNKRIKMKVSDL